MNKYFVFSWIISFFIFLFLPGISHASELSFQSDKTVLQIGDQLRIQVNLAGNEDNLGTDLVIKYDPTIVEVLEITPSAIYPNYMPATSNRINKEKGQVMLSGVANFGQQVKANGNLAIMTVKAIKSGQTKISFVYEEGATNATGVLNSKGENLITQSPQDINLVIQSPPWWQTIIDGILAPVKFFTSKLSGK